MTDEDRAAREEFYKQDAEKMDVAGRLQFDTVLRPPSKRDLVQEAHKLKCPVAEQDVTLEEIGPGVALNMWVALVLDTAVFPFSENAEGLMIGMKALARMYDYVGLVFYRFKHDWDGKRNVPRPKEKWKGEWTLSFMGPLEGQLVFPDENPNIAFCKGVIAQSYVMEEKHKMLAEFLREEQKEKRGEASGKRE